MTTISINILDDSILEKIKSMLSVFPADKIQYIETDKDIEYVSDEEQTEIEEILKDPDCHTVAFSETIEI